MRPAVSTYFSLPVKNGWQAEQISTFSSFLVLRVLKVLPQLHVTLVTTYWGWMPSFMARSFGSALSAARSCGLVNQLSGILKFIGMRAEGQEPARRAMLALAVKRFTTCEPRMGYPVLDH